ncbi:MAG: hypothetical protein A2Y41_05945 [Spirochaetes bacterium GWB1_36_13]|nr:MAG: hypothetical protein A2Y41_05945 [Spirochaetes bacterium GWB1_36_13]
MINEYSISIIIPVYNEYTLIDKSIEEYHTFLKENFIDYEIILIESGSTDGSYEKCDEIVKKYNKIKIVHEGAKKGFGSAVKEGYKNATKDLIVLTTLDFPFPLGAILKGISLIEKYDYVLSYRSKDPRKISRKIQSFIYNLIIKIFLRLRVKHVNSGFKMFRREYIQDLEIKSNGWFLDAEVLYLLKKKKLKFTQIPVELIDRTVGKSSVGTFAFLHILKEMFHLIFREK